MVATLLLLSVLGMPVVEKPAQQPTQPYFAIFLTGDGGWRAIDASITRQLNRNGISVVGLLSDDYFASARTEAEVGRDVGALIDRYASRWQKRQVLLIGYSRGADAIPIALARMNAEQRSRVALAVLLGPARTAELEIVPWWRPGADPPPSIVLAPIMRSIRGTRLMCVHGKGEDDSLCDVLPEGFAIDVEVPGGHHFDGAYDDIARHILAALPKNP